MCSVAIACSWLNQKINWALLKLEYFIHYYKLLLISWLIDLKRGHSSAGLFLTYSQKPGLGWSPELERLFWWVLGTQSIEPSLQTRSPNTHQSQHYQEPGLGVGTKAWYQKLQYRCRVPIGVLAVNLCPYSITFKGNIGESHVKGDVKRVGRQSQSSMWRFHFIEDFSRVFLRYCWCKWEYRKQSNAITLLVDSLTWRKIEKLFGS